MNIAIYTLTSELHDEQAAYFLNAPIGNHHVIMPGHHKKVLSELIYNKV